MTYTLQFQKQVKAAYREYKKAIRGAIFYSDLLHMESIVDHPIKVTHYGKVWYI